MKSANTLPLSSKKRAIIKSHHSKRFELITRAKNFGVRSRRTPKGPETKLVEKFLLDLPLDAKQPHRITVFKEPKLQSGFPDLVAVFWHEPTTMRWDPIRTGISGDDVRLVHLLTNFGPLSEDRIEYFLHQRVQKYLDRLSDVGLVYKRRGMWRAFSLRETFAVRRIVAFEAKVSNWRNAIDQAALNKWFTPESYILIPQALRENNILEAARKASIGVWVVGDPRPRLDCPSDDTRQPISYASWLFNEWSWRCARVKDQTSKEARA
ncbi:MAG: hypothetical protein PHE84_05865 [bacterium]|nr:hypothetical protein [bacterium]